MSKEMEIVEEASKHYQEEINKTERGLFGKNTTTTKDQKIADLEAKLAEKRQDCVALDKAWNNLNNQLSIKNDEINELKQQLAEKEEIIDWQNEIVDGVKQEEELLAQKLKSLGVDCIEDLGKTYDQEKISFAVEQINKLKNDLYDNEKINIRACDFDEIDNIFDNQIKQLKEMK